MWDDGKQLTECVEALRALAARDLEDRGIRGGVGRMNFECRVGPDGALEAVHLAAALRRGITWGSGGIYEWTPDAGARRIA